MLDEASESANGETTRFFRRPTATLLCSWGAGWRQIVAKPSPIISAPPATVRARQERGVKPDASDTNMPSPPDCEGLIRGDTRSREAGPRTPVLGQTQAALGPGRAPQQRRACAMGPPCGSAPASGSSEPSCSPCLAHSARTRQDDPPRTKRGLRPGEQWMHLRVAVPS